MDFLKALKTGRTISETMKVTGLSRGGVIQAMRRNKKLIKKVGTKREHERGPESTIYQLRAGTKKVITPKQYKKTKVRKTKGYGVRAVTVTNDTLTYKDTGEAVRNGTVTILGSSLPSPTPPAGTTFEPLDAEAQALLNDINQQATLKLDLAPVDANGSPVAEPAEGEGCA
jgi:predicted SPOUT superfamily RNA methylase MTH1